MEASQTLLELPGGIRIGLSSGLAGAEEGGDVTLGIRPEHLVPGKGHQNKIGGVVVLVEHLGDHALVYLEWQADEPPLVVRLGTEEMPALGDALSVGLPGEHCYLFDREGTGLLVWTG